MPDDEELKTLNLEPSTWTAINRQKRPGESADDVLRRLLGHDVEIGRSREYVNINVYESTKDEVEDIKRDGETFDEVVSRLAGVGEVEP
jgi:negative regulator of replication initiation